ncbi:hypothetical protein K9L16_00270 [Candidatus Pacearchaeota archaeon]|nr:hypothetical protein [Candidatus Pacearchaeota archaeon]
MCFTPIISLITAIIEILVGTYILKKYKDELVSVFSAILIYFLGAYQLAEFFLCTTNNPETWARIGFIIYTLLPAMGLHFSLRLTKVSKKNLAIYFIPLLIIFITLFSKEFIISAGCEKFFVLIKTSIMSEQNIFLTAIYGIYYFGYIVFSEYFLINQYKKEKGKLNKKIEIMWALFGGLTIILPIILIIIIPSIGIQFPSIYCEFALLFTIVALWSSNWYHRKKKKENF